MLRKIVNRHVAWMAAVVAVGCTGGLLSAPAVAQPFQPPIRDNVDPNGVDLINLNFTLNTTEVAIGVPGQGGMAYTRSNYGSQSSWTDNYTGGITVYPSLVSINIGNKTESFTGSGGSYTPAQGQGSALSYNSGNQTYTLTRFDGTVAIFNITGNDGAGDSWGTMISLAYPNGEKITLNYLQAQLCVGTTCGPAFTLNRLQSATNNFGYQIRFNYTIGGTQVPYANVGLWQTVIGVTAINMAVDYCDPLAQSCSYSVTWPSVTYASPDTNTQTVTDALGHVTTYLYNAGPLIGIRRPLSGSSNTTSIGYDASWRYVTSVIKGAGTGAGTWTYSAPTDSGDQRTVTVTDPLGHTRTVSSSKSQMNISSDTNGVGKKTQYGYDFAGRLQAMLLSEGGTVTYTYDANGNLTQTCYMAKTRTQPCNPTAGDITTTAHFPSTCTSAVTCNQPDYTLDELGNETDYTYDSTHGGVLTVTSPAPQSGGVRPQTRNTYTALYAWYKNSSGTIVQAPTPVYQLTQVSACATTSSCAGGADEIRTTIAYGSDGVANNRLPTTITKSNGSGTLSATTTKTYDAIGNLASVDGPLGGSADTTVYRYDAARRRVGVEGPDPDGAGVLKLRATRFTYDVDGNVVAIEQGTVADTSDTSWTNFAVLAKQTLAWDTLDRPTQNSSVVVPGTSLGAVTQYAYDTASHLTCVAVRMNSAVFGSLPADACTLSTPQGSDGPDRITHFTYDAANRLSKKTAGYQTAAPIDTLTQTYTDDGLRSTAADGAGHLSTFEYDGFDRLHKLRYPDPTNGTVSSTTVFDLYTYDNASNLTQLQRRDGTTIINFGYDALNRLHTRTPSVAADAVTYAYDNLGRMASAATPGQSLSFTFDALDRLINQAGPEGTLVSAWDVAGRRTQLTWPDGFYVNYDYDTANEMTAVRENGATSGVGVLASFTYDDLGRRTKLSRGNGVITTYGYDSLSRLTSLTQDLSGTANDQTFALNYNAASQINHRSTTNTTYDWNGTPGNASYGANGQNELTATGLQYADNRGNLTSDGTTTYGFDAENRLTSASGSPAATLSYDPDDRLFQTTGAATTRFSYDGTNLSGEYSGSNVLLRRYVYGPRQDEPLVWYEGSATTDRRWLVADPRGSVIAVTDGTGTATQIDRYDDYGIPGVSNPTRFQYTGQIWVPEAALYYYKARMYHPRLGRFLQTDPTGYNAGMNLYAYAGNDPVNQSDPTGLDSCSSGDDFTVVICGTPGPNDCGVTDDTVTVCGSQDPGWPYVPGTPWYPIPGTPTARPNGTGTPHESNQQAPEKDCKAESGWAKAAKILDDVSEYSGDAALGAGIAALATSETVVGGIAFGAIAAGAEITSKVTGIAAAIVRFTIGDTRGGIVSSVAMVVGGVVPRGLGSLTKPIDKEFAREVADVAGDAAERVAEAAACHW